MSYSGNRLAFGKLSRTDAPMNCIDMDSSDPFDFYLDHYKVASLKIFSQNQKKGDSQTWVRTSGSASNPMMWPKFERGLLGSLRPC